MTRTAPKHAAKKKRATRKSISVQVPTGLNINLPPVHWPSLIKYAIMFGAAAMSWATMKSDVSHLKDDTAAMKVKIDALYQHFAFRETGAAGPVVVETSRSVSTTTKEEE